MDVIGPKVTQLSLTRAEFWICNPFSVGPFVVVSSCPTRDSVGTNVRRIERRKRCARGRDASAMSAHGTRQRMYPHLCLRKGERLRNVPSALLQLHSSPRRSKVDLWELLFVFLLALIPEIMDLLRSGLQHDGSFILWVAYRLKGTNTCNFFFATLFLVLS
jgi:hypothetical protein